MFNGIFPIIRSNRFWNKRTKRTIPQSIILIVLFSRIFVTAYKINITYFSEVKSQFITKNRKWLFVAVLTCSVFSSVMCLLAQYECCMWAASFRYGCPHITFPSDLFLIFPFSLSFSSWKNRIIWIFSLTSFVKLRNYHLLMSDLWFWFKYFKPLKKCM